MIAAIGIDRYVEWPRLGNAVSDALGAAQLFERLGFEQVTAPLLDEAATGETMRRLVTDDLAQLSAEDSLVVFFAGHGHTHLTTVGSVSVKTGCVIPVDAARPRGHVSASWLRLDGWLSDIARLPPRHILVIVDACYSGVALSSLHKWRDDGSWPIAEQTALHGRRSRRIITSALDDQRAMDSGPVAGHSLFTGCLIEALSGGLAEPGRRMVTGRELGQYLQRRVDSYPQSTQTPDFSTFELDDRGDIFLPILVEGDEPRPEHSAARTIPRGQPLVQPTTIPGVGPAVAPRSSEGLMVPPAPRRWLAMGRETELEASAMVQHVVMTNPGMGPLARWLPGSSMPAPPALASTARSSPPHDGSSGEPTRRRSWFPIVVLVAGALVTGYALGPADLDCSTKEPPPPATDIGSAGPPNAIGSGTQASRLPSASGNEAKASRMPPASARAAEPPPAPAVVEKAEPRRPLSVVGAEAKPPRIPLVIDAQEKPSRAPAAVGTEAESRRASAPAGTKAKPQRTQAARSSTRCDVPDYARYPRDLQGCVSDPDGLMRP